MNYSFKKRVGLLNKNKETIYAIFRKKKKKN